VLLLSAWRFLLFRGIRAVSVATGQFLPHDVEYLGMTAKDLCHNRPRPVVHSCFRSRLVFGGSLIADRLALYVMAGIPLRGRQAWVWWCREKQKARALNRAFLVAQVSTCPNVNAARLTAA